MIQNAVLTMLFILGMPFTLYGVYFLAIGLMGLRRHRPYPEAPPKNRFAAVIAARNEAEVIGNLIDSLRDQDYPRELVDIYVLPNNCTDNTEAVARAHGAKTYACSGAVHSKGAALEEFFDATLLQNDNYDAYCVFDADNLVDPHFFSGMNGALCAGETMAQGYREGKNPISSWVSGSQTIFYYTIDRFLNLARTHCRLSALLNGTGFMIAADVLKDGGFRTFTLTEDIEFTTQNIIKGRRVAWVPEAKIYDEVPETFGASWKQRMRWSTGTIQCFTQYAPQLWHQFRQTKHWACMDMILYLAAPLVQVFQTIFSAVTFIITAMLAINLQNFSNLTTTVLSGVGGIVLTVLFALWLVKLEKHPFRFVKRSAFVSFWFWLMSWMVINVACILQPLTTWEPIAHTHNIQLKQLQMERAE